MVEIVLRISDAVVDEKTVVRLDMDCPEFQDKEQVPTTPATLSALAIKRIFDSDMVEQLIVNVLPEYFVKKPDAEETTAQ